MLEKHCKNCSVDQLTRKNFRSPDIHEPKKKSNEVNLPRIRNSARESADRRNNLEVKKPLSSVKIREDLRCFRKAEEVPKVLCENCGRKFAEKAALRHLPVCEKLRKKQDMANALQKQSKSMFTKTKMKSTERMKESTLKEQKGKEQFFGISLFFPEEIKEVDIEQSIDNKASEKEEPKQEDILHN